jgi:hypothetical protein
MKLNFKNSPTIASEDMNVSKMGVASGAEDMIAGFLRDKIYSNKTLACIRETITNSQDEHIKYGIDKAVEVKLENVNGQYVWSSRDFAKGLSEESIRTIYGMYGGSDKRNNNNQVGGFGVGALSPFAVSDSFYITSYHEGLKTQYACILGAGDNGLSVGEIYRVSDPEPTTESGLEVSLDVNKNYYNFSTESASFVERFLPNANIKFTDQYDVEHTPIQPLLTKDIGDYTINLYQSTFWTSPDYVAIRMGGIVYNMRSDIKVVNPLGKIVVDVPIGKLTVPISRESIEDTPNNKKVLDEITDAIVQLSDEDRSKIVTPKFGEAILENKHNSYYEGEWFRYSFSNTFPDTYKIQKCLDYIHTGYGHNKTTGKYVVYQIPDIKSYKGWVKRLDQYIAGLFPNTQIVWMLNKGDILSTDTLDVSDVTFVDVKKLGLPKLAKDPNEVRYVVYFNGHKRNFTAEELDEHVTDKSFNGVEIVDGWEKSIDSISYLRQRVIGLTSECGVNNPYWVCNSKKMKEQLLELGWFELNSPEYTKRCAELNVIEQAKRDMENAEYRVKSAMFRIHPSQRLIKVIGKNPSKLTRLNMVKNKILKENSFRGRVLSSIETYNTKITREDLRKILTTK